MVPEVSIVTCMYNAEPYIMETARSILGQTFREFEWLIVDDCSSDASLDIVRRLAAEDGRITVRRLAKRSGPVCARNEAIREARGRFIAFIDSDDLWLPEKLEKQLSFMRQRRAALSYTGYRKIDEQGRLKTGIRIPVPARSTYGSILRSDCIMASSAMYDTEFTGRILQPYDAPVGRDDLFFFLTILGKHNFAHGLNEDLARLRIHNDSLTGNKIRAAILQWRLYRRVVGLSVGQAARNYLIYAVKGFCKYLL